MEVIPKKKGAKKEGSSFFIQMAPRSPFFLRLPLKKEGSPIFPFFCGLRLQGGFGPPARNRKKLENIGNGLPQKIGQNSRKTGKWPENPISEPFFLFFGYFFRIFCGRPFPMFFLVFPISCGMPAEVRCEFFFCELDLKIEIWNCWWEKSSEIWGEDFSACQASTRNFGENFGNFVSNFASFFFQKLRSAEGRC